MSEELFYLQSHGVCGNSVLWWAINNRGYTCDIRCARVWTQSELDKKGLREIDIPWKKDQVDRLIQHHVDIQDLNYKDNEGELAKYPHTIMEWRTDLVV